MTRQALVKIDKTVSEKYTIAGGGFPSDDINPTLKDRAWTLQFTLAVLNQHFMGGTVFPYFMQDGMIEKRAYMNGCQSPKKYYPRAFGKKISDDPTKLAQRLGMYRSNWRIQPIIPPAIDYIKAKFDEVDYDVRAKSLNPLVNEMKESKEFYMLAQGMLPKERFAVLSQMGINVPPETVVNSPEEMNLFKSIGGLKPAEEYVAQVLISHIFANTDWKFIHNLAVEDICCFNKAILKDTIDIYSGKVGAEYVDPVNFIGLIDRQSSASDFCYAGHIKLMSIKEIRARLKKKGLYDDACEKTFLVPSAQMFMNQFNNRFLFGSTAFEYLQDRNGFTYDVFHVPVVDLEYKTINTEYRKYRVNGSGETKYLRTDYGSDDPDVVTNSKEYFYKSLMVLGTDLVFDWGPCGDQQREGLTKVRSSFHMITSPNPSMVDRTMCIADDVAFDYIKYQHDAAVAPPNSIAISKSAIENNSQDGNNLTEGESLDMMLSSAKIIYNDIQIVGNSIMNNAIPVKQMPGGMGEVLNEYVMKYNLSLAQMRQVLNIQQTEALPRVAVDVAMLAETQTNRAISEIISMMKQLKEMLASGCYKRVKLAIKYNKAVYNGHYPLVGRTGLETVKLTADMSGEDMGFVFVAKPTNVEAQSELERLARLAEPTASGLPKIEGSTYYAVRDMILLGQLEVARAYLLSAERKRIDMEQALAERNSQIQAAIIQAAEKAKHQRETDLIWQKAKAENWLQEQNFVREQTSLSLQANIPPQTVVA